MRVLPSHVASLFACAAFTFAFRVAAQAPPPPPPPPPPPAAPGATPAPATTASAPIMTGPASTAPAPTPAPPPPPPPSTTAAGTQPPPPAPPPPPPPPADAVAIGAGAQTHDGLYLRLALGGGVMSMNRDTDEKGISGSSSIKGASTAFELSIGGTPGDGLVIAGTLLSQAIPNPTLKSDQASDVDLPAPLTLNVLGVSMDWFPNPTGGFHVGATLGFAGAAAPRPKTDVFNALGGLGGALAISTGYDFWIADQWSLGALIRLTGARLSSDQRATDPTTQTEVEATETDSVTAFAIYLTALYH